MSKGLEIKIAVKGKLLSATGDTGRGNNIFAGTIKDKKVLDSQVKRISEAVALRVRKNILEEKNYLGGNLARLKKSTIEKKGFSNVLIDTGKLLKNIALKKEGTNYVIYVKPQSYSSGVTTTEVASYTQEGDKKRKRPARKFFGITQKDFNIIVNSVLDKRILTKKDSNIKLSTEEILQRVLKNN